MAKALLVVDVQNDFVTGSLAVSGASAIIPTITKLAAVFNDGWNKVLATKDFHPADHSSFEQWPPHCVAGTEGCDLANGIELVLSAPAFLKGRDKDVEEYSGFANRRLAPYLKEHYVRELFICGIATDYCVLKTVLDALKYVPKVYVIEDACAAVTPETGAAALEEMKNAGAIIVKSAECYFLDPTAGSRIDDCFREAAELADKIQESINLKFNDREFIIAPGSDPDKLYADWKEDLDRRRKEWEESDEGKEYKRQQEEAEAALAADWAQGFKPFTITNQEVWDKGVEANQDMYGKGVYHFAARWANMVEAKLAEGAAFADVVKQCSYDADIEGMSGFSYGCAVNILVHCWSLGEQLRRWHNLDCQLGDEGERANETGGVLNPALLNIG